MANPLPRNRESLSERLRKLVAPEELPETKPDARLSPRTHTYIFARICVEENLEVDCVIRDLSDGGARIRLEAPRPLPATVRLTIPESGQTKICRLAWQKARHAGLAFWDAKRNTYDAASQSELNALED